MSPIREGLNFVLPPPGKKYLGDLTVAAGVVKAHFDAVMEEYKQFQHGNKTRDAAIAAIDALAIENAKILRGENKDYALSPWQERGMLRGEILTSRSIKGPDDDQTAEECQFRFMGKIALRAAMDLDDGTAPQQVGPELTVGMRDLTNMIVGINRGGPTACTSAARLPPRSPRPAAPPETPRRCPDPWHSSKADAVPAKSGPPPPRSRN